jgi:hypothetical protein
LPALKRNVLEAQQLVGGDLTAFEANHQIDEL